MWRRENGSPDRVTTSAAVVVIGGGVIGASIAYHLALQGVDDVIIIDRAHGPGAGSTGRATGGFRAQFATPVNVQLSLLSRAALLRFENETGVDPGYQQVGYLWLASDETQLDALRAANGMQRTQGLSEARLIDVDEIRNINPLINVDGVVGGAFCPTDGYIRPLDILRGYLESAERLGVRFLWETECIAIKRVGDRIDTIETSRGSISIDYAVNAAGPWAAAIAAMANIDLPVTALRRQAAFTFPCSTIPASMPMTIFMDTGFHVRARDGRAFIARPTSDIAGDPGELKADDEWIDDVEKLAHERIPVLRDCAVDRSLCYAGLYEMSPDHHAILGKSPNCENMLFANGSSGHGVMHSPAIGAIIADMLQGKKPQIDVSMLRPSRFDEGMPVEQAELL